MAVDRAELRTAAAILALVVAYAVLPFRGERWWIGAAIGLAVLFATIPLTVRRVRAVLVSSRPLIEAAEALLLLLTMLVIGFAALYFAMDRDEGQFGGIETRLDAVYFTVTTLTTVGFGDIVATGQWARAAVTFQMLFDLAFIGITARVLLTAARRGQSAAGR